METVEKISPFVNTSEFKFWRSMSDDIWDDAMVQSNIIKKPKGTTLQHESCKPNDRFYILLSGVVKVYGLSENGRGIFIDQLEAGDICPIVVSSLLGQPIVEVQSIAHTDISLLSFPKQYFYELMETSERFRMHILKKMTLFSGVLVDLVKQVSFCRLPARVAYFLTKIYGKYNQAHIPFTHQGLANELGTTREVMSRLLKDMETQGCIKLKRGAIEIVCTEKLMEYSRSK